MRPPAAPPSALHFGLAGILSGIYFFVGLSFLMGGPGIPIMSSDPVHLGLLAVTAVAIVYSMEESIRTIACGSRVGWALLLANCVYALMVVPVMAIHISILLETRRAA